MCMSFIIFLLKLTNMLLISNFNEYLFINIVHLVYLCTMARWKYSISKPPAPLHGYTQKNGKKFLNKHQINTHKTILPIVVIHGSIFFIGDALQGKPIEVM